MGPWTGGLTPLGNYVATSRVGWCKMQETRRGVKTMWETRKQVCWPAGKNAASGGNSYASKETPHLLQNPKSNSGGWDKESQPNLPADPGKDDLGVQPAGPKQQKTTKLY